MEGNATARNDDLRPVHPSVQSDLMITNDKIFFFLIPLIMQMHTLKVDNKGRPGSTSLLGVGGKKIN